MGLRERRLAVAAGFHAGILALGMGGVFLGVALSIPVLFDVAGLLLLTHLLTCSWNPLVRLLQERLLSRHRCGQCDLVLDLMAPWRCGCGFTVGERHAFSSCPQCDKQFAWINCPRCGAGILV